VTPEDAVPKTFPLRETVNISNDSPVLMVPIVCKTITWRDKRIGAVKSRFRSRGPLSAVHLRGSAPVCTARDPPRTIASKHPLLLIYSAGTYTPRRRTVAMGGWTTIMKAVIPACEL
jgi:hypothetical protein